MTALPTILSILKENKNGYHYQLKKRFQEEAARAHARGKTYLVVKIMVLVNPVFESQVGENVSALGYKDLTDRVPKGKIDHDTIVN